MHIKGHFTHKTESPWPLHFKHSHWWKRRRRSKFASHYVWGTNGVCECKVDVKSTWIPTWHRMVHGHLDYFQNQLSCRQANTKLGDHGTPNAQKMLICFSISCVRHAWIQIHRNSIWLRARSHMSSHYTWGSVTKLHDSGGVLGRPSDTFFWALTISWSRPLACVSSGPKVRVCVCVCVVFFSLLLITSTLRFSCVALPNVHQSINKKWIENRTSHH